VRVTGAKRDDLQAAMALLRKERGRPAAELQQLPRLMTPPARCVRRRPPGAGPLPAGPRGTPPRLQVQLAGAWAKALLVIDGQPQTLAVGASAGASLLSLEGDDRPRSSGGKRLSLRVGASPAVVGGRACGKPAASTRDRAHRRPGRPLHDQRQHQRQARAASWSTPAPRWCR
jgi:hypothetical protein